MGARHSSSGCPWRRHRARSAHEAGPGRSRGRCNGRGGHGAVRLGVRSFDVQRCHAGHRCALRPDESRDVGDERPAGRRGPRAPGVPRQGRPPPARAGVACPRSGRGGHGGLQPRAARRGPESRGAGPWAVDGAGSGCGDRPRAARRRAARSGHRGARRLRRRATRRHRRRHGARRRRVGATRCRSGPPPGATRTCRRYRHRA